MYTNTHTYIHNVIYFDSQTGGNKQINKTFVLSTSVENLREISLVCLLVNVKHCVGRV